MREMMVMMMMMTTIMMRVDHKEKGWEISMRMDNEDQGT